MAKILIFSAIAAAIAVVRKVSSTPSPTFIGSDLTFLFQNDLNWPLAPEHDGSVMINKPSTNAQALASCKQLSESFFHTNGTFFESDIKSLLSYLTLETFNPQQKFWISSNSPGSCSAISVNGGIESVDCNSRLPAFCSQSAPPRLSNQTDLSAQYQIEVKSKKLTLLGTRDHLSFRFLGIPYADPFERFAYSKLFSGTANLNALTYGSPCLQAAGGNEDCLFLNVYTPFLPVNATASKENLKPVLFWIHGGGFTDGTGAMNLYDGGNMASRNDVVVVTINYRLGTLGFLALEDGVTNGNFGIGDMVTALEWVQVHIADFGGDPKRVTIAGQSAGASSVRVLLESKPATGLFAAAIGQSNLGGVEPADTFSEYMSIEKQFTSYAEPTIELVGCGGKNGSSLLDCLRSVDGAELFGSPNASTFIVVDGKFVTTDHLELTGNGSVARVPVIFGWLRNDGAVSIPSFPSDNTTEIQVLLSAGLTSKVTDLAVNSPLFPVPAGPNATLNIFNVSSRIVTDGAFRCINQATVEAAARNNVFEKIYAYQFDRSYTYETTPAAYVCRPPETPEFPAGDPNLPYFRCHAGDIQFTFGTLGQTQSPFRDANDPIMSQVITDMWASFARTFDPNPDAAFLAARGYSNTTEILRKAGTWEPVTSQNLNSKPLRILDIPMSDSAFQDVDQCALLGVPLNMYEQSN